MISDIGTVMWKERKGLLRPGGSKSRMVVSLLVPLLMIAVFLPIQIGRDWLTTGWPLIAAAIIPLVVVGITVPESFAGERERHTLETLLASRLSDRAVLFGKLGISIIFGWGATITVLVISMVVVNALAWTGRILFYQPILALAHVIVSLLMTVLVASLGC